MKMKKLLVSLLAFGLYVQEAPAQSGTHFTTGSATRKLSDGGDTNRYVSTGSAANADMSMVAPTAYGSEMASDCGCGEYSEYASCGSCGNFGGGGAGGCVCSPTGWFTAETLLVFAANRSSPVLATTAGANTYPIQDDPGVTSEFGGTLSSDLLPGYRMSAGRYFGPQKKVGIGARGYGIYDGSSSFEIESDGSTSVGVPFFNLSAGSLTNQVIPGQTGATEDAYIVAGRTTAGLPISAGGLRVEETLKMVGGELSGYFLLARSGCSRTDLVAGYTYNQLRNRINLETRSTNQFTGDGIANGTVLETRDTFSADNRFNGAHLGVLSSVVRNRVNLSTLAKISFGSMRSRIGIDGANAVNGVGDQGGIFALASNIGTTYADRFAFLPEVGIKMGYCVRPNVQLTVGYTLLVWSDVVLAGEQIDRTLNLTGLGTRPGPLNKHSAYWMQSIDLGLNLVY